MAAESHADQGKPDLMAALEESMRAIEKPLADRWICTCGRQFVSRAAAAGHLEPRPGWDGFHFCGGTLSPLASDDERQR